MEPWNYLKGQVVMATGASSEIGLEFCLDLVKAGCNIIATACCVEIPASLCDQINSNSEGATCAVAVELDVAADGSTFEAAAQIAWDTSGRIDVLINNGIRGSVSSSTELSEEGTHTLHTNLRGAWLMSKYVCRCMRDAKRGRGSVINITSAAALNRAVYKGSLAYVSSKWLLTWSLK